MPWHRGHTLFIFSALCLSQRNQGSLGVLTQLASLPHHPLPLPLCSHPALPVYHTMPYHTLFSLFSLRPLLIQFHSPIMLLSCSWISLYLPVCLPCCLLYPYCSLSLQMTFEDSSLSDKQSELDRKKKVSISVFPCVLCKCVCAQGKIRKINGASEKSILPWPWLYGQAKIEHCDH